jgi:hypothetical protein
MLKRCGDVNGGTLYPRFTFARVWQWKEAAARLPGYSATLASN